MKKSRTILKDIEVGEKFYYCNKPYIKTEGGNGKKFNGSVIVKMKSGYEVRKEI